MHVLRRDRPTTFSRGPMYTSATTNCCYCLACRPTADQPRARRGDAGHNVKDSAVRSDTGVKYSQLDRPAECNQKLHGCGRGKGDDENSRADANLDFRLQVGVTAIMQCIDDKPVCQLCHRHSKLLTARTLAIGLMTRVLESSIHGHSSQQRLKFATYCIYRTQCVDPNVAEYCHRNDYKFNVSYAVRSAYSTATELLVFLVPVSEQDAFYRANGAMH